MNEQPEPRYLQPASPAPQQGLARSHPPPPPPDRLASESVVVSAPMSCNGAAKRAWRLTTKPRQAWVRWLVIVGVLLLILLWWTVILAWYLIWGIFLVPYRLIRRGSRKRKIAALQHRETLE